MNIKHQLCLILTLTVILITPSQSATNDDFFIPDAQEITFSKNTLHSSNSNTKYISFSSFEQNFDLILQEKNQLMNGYSAKHKSIKLFTGKIKDNDNSWARITVINDKYTGAIFDGKELYMLDVGENINGALTNNTDMSDVKTVMYKSSEVSSHLNCGDHGPHEHQFSYKKLLSASTRQQFNPALGSLNVDVGSNSEFEVATATASQQVNLRIVADPSYAASSDLDAEAQVLSQMNIVDGIFSDQVGVQFGITDIEVLTNNGSLTSTDPSALLTQFRTFIGNDHPGLAHLFTGRNLDGNTIGIASLSAICSTSGNGLTQAGGRGAFGALTAAHEFGHNFGAPHDNQAGSACAATPGDFLMNPSLNGSDQFSQCSLEQIANTILTRGQCLVPVDTAPAAPAPSCDFSVDFTNGDNDFNFVSDPQTPTYSSSSAFGGSINTLLGGVDNDNISDIQGVWARQCISDGGGNTTFNLEASLTQSSEYEANEFSQIALRVNGVTSVLDTVTGNGNGGPDLSTGVRQYSVDVALNSGTNTIELVCFNNAKTAENETTECQFNRLETNDASELCFPIKTQDSEFTTICL